MKMLLFDIDGTLLLTGGSGKIAFERAFEEVFKIPNAWGDLHPDGKTDPLIFDEVLEKCLDRPATKDEKKALHDRYVHHFPITLKSASGFRLMPGVEALLGALSTQPVLMGLATGNLESTAWMKLGRAGLSSYFDFGGFGSDAACRKALTREAVKKGLLKSDQPISNDDIFVIGDTPYDIQAALALHLNTIAVATGSYSKKDLQSHQPHHCLSDLTDINQFLKLIRLNGDSH